MTTHTVTAPGKIVAWGEYAVLAGAPACVLAVDRFATVSVQAAEGLRISAQGFSAEDVISTQLAWSQAPAARMVETILQHWGYTNYPAHLHISQDTRPFYQANNKLGIGSSAALCVALYRALAAALDRPTVLEEALHIHHHFQGGSGSGLDVAASWLGGAIHYQLEQAPRAVDWPAELGFCAVFTGHSASTAQHVGQFSRWRESGDTTSLDALCAASTELSRTFTTDQLAHYIRSLRRLDEAADLNIFTAQHLALAEIAAATGVLYKPCGAGGGDIGMAFCFDHKALEAFRAHAASDYHPLQVNIAPSTKMN